MTRFALMIGAAVMSGTCWRVAEAVATRRCRPAAVHRRRRPRRPRIWIPLRSWPSCRRRPRRRPIHPGRLRRARHEGHDSRGPLCARNGVPILGICYGLHMMVEFLARQGAARGSSTTATLLRSWKWPAARGALLRPARPPRVSPVLLASGESQLHSAEGKLSGPAALH